MPHRLLTNPRAPSHPLPTRCLRSRRILFSYAAATPPPPTPHLPPHLHHLPIPHAASPPPSRLLTYPRAPAPAPSSSIVELSSRDSPVAVPTPALSLELSLSMPALVAVHPFLFLGPRLAVRLHHRRMCAGGCSQNSRPPWTRAAIEEVLEALQVRRRGARRRRARGVDGAVQLCPSCSSFESFSWLWVEAVMAGQSDLYLSIFSDPSEVEFVAEDEVIGIVPNIHMDALNMVYMIHSNCWCISSVAKGQSWNRSVSS